MSILDTGRAGLNQALKAMDSSTNLANQMQAERSQLAVANKQADSSTTGQMAGLAGSAALTYGPEAISGLATLGTDAAVTGGTALAAEGTAAAAASVVPVAGWIAAAGILAYSLFS